MENFLNLFRHEWISAGNSTSRLWPASKELETYTRVPSQWLLDLERSAGGLPWGATLVPEEEMILRQASVLGPGERGGAIIDDVVEKVGSLGLELPVLFVRFMKDLSMQGLIPTCTDCYVELAPDVIPIPAPAGQGIGERTPGYLLRFLHDSQCCMLWHLWLIPGEQARVVASRHFFEQDYFEALQDCDEPITYGEAFRQAVHCAGSFEEFLHRFWMENMIWFARYRNLALSPRLAEYETFCHRQWTRLRNES